MWIAMISLAGCYRCFCVCMRLSFILSLCYGFKKSGGEVSEFIFEEKSKLNLYCSNNSRASSRRSSFLTSAENHWFAYWMNPLCAACWTHTPFEFNSALFTKYSCVDSGFERERAILRNVPKWQIELCRLSAGEAGRSRTPLESVQERSTQRWHSARGDLNRAHGSGVTGLCNNKLQNLFPGPTNRSRRVEKDRWEATVSLRLVTLVPAAW